MLSRIYTDTFAILARNLIENALKLGPNRSVATTPSAEGGPRIANAGASCAASGRHKSQDQAESLHGKGVTTASRSLRVADRPDAGAIALRSS